jgi:hypothetical protein
VCVRIVRKFSNSNFKQPRLLVLAPPREFELLVFSPLFEGRWSAERRALVVTKCAFRTLHRGDFFVPGTGSSERGRELFSPSRQVSPPFTRLVQPLKAEPRSGLGRLPKAPRCHACEAQPRAPHPTGSGYPSPIKLSLCPTSGSPLEAPLTGQDTGRISEVLRAGIGIHSQVRERQACALLVARVSAATSGTSIPSNTDPGCRCAHPGYARFTICANRRRRCAANASSASPSSLPA